jgi:hypothetical protein
VKSSKKAPDSPTTGKQILETGYQPLPPLNKDEFKFFKPWTLEQNVPKWVEELQSAPLSVVL